MISIIIPTFNEKRYLPTLLSSIKDQTFKDYEVIVSDASSSDGTILVAKRFGCKIVKGGLPATGRNNGAKAAKGEILLFMDADAKLDKGFLKKSFFEFNKRKLGIAGCVIKPIGNNLLDKIFFAIFNLWTRITQFFYPNASGCGIFVKRSLHEKIRGFNEKLKLSEDMDYVNRCSKHGKFRLLRNVHVRISMRRFEKEGRFKVGFKLLLSAFYRIFYGEIKTDVFKYNLRYRK